MDATPPSMAFEPRQTSVGRRTVRIAHNGFARIEQWLEVEREQLALWVPVALGAGIAGWFVLPGPAHWLACCCSSQELEPSVLGSLPLGPAC